MECKNCHQSVETGAAFCGNCGTQLAAVNPVYESLGVEHALATPEQHTGEIQAVTSVLLGVAGIFGAGFRPFIGLSLGIFGLVLATLTRHSVRRNFSTAGIVFSSLAIVCGLAGWTYAVTQAKHEAKAASSQTPTSQSANLSTPCYSTNFVDRLNVISKEDSCTMSAFNGDTIETSTTAYKVYASKANINDSFDFTSIAKQALEKDVKDKLPSFEITTQRVSGFAGSPAYTVTAVDKSNRVAVTETAVYHPTESGDNIFVLVHAVNDDNVDLSILEAQWQWK